jgi:hypothetical protein
MATVSATVLSVSLVSGTDDDLAANLAAFEAQYLAHMDNVVNLTDKIHNAVHAVFDKYPNAPIAMPSLINFAMAHLSYTPDTFKDMSAAVGEYVRENADRHEKTDKETGVVTQVAEAPRTRQFKIAKGKSGGCLRWSDIPVKTDQK